MMPVCVINLLWQDVEDLMSLSVDFVSEELSDTMLLNLLTLTSQEMFTIISLQKEGLFHLRERLLDEIGKDRGSYLEIERLSGLYEKAHKILSSNFSLLIENKEQMNIEAMSIYNIRNLIGVVQEEVDLGTCLN